MNQLDVKEIMIPGKVITDELCEDFGKFVALMALEPETENADFEQIVSKLYHLGIEKDDTLSTILKYDFKTNKLLLNHQLDGDLNHAVVKESYLMLTNGSWNTPALMAISEGYRDNLAERLVGNERQTDALMDEKIIASLVERIIGSSKLAESHFGNKPAMINSVLSPDLQMMIGDNYLNRHHRKVSRLGEIEKALIDRFFEIDDLTPEAIADFRLNLCSNPNYYTSNPDMYSSVAGVCEHFDSYQNNKIL